VSVALDAMQNSFYAPGEPTREEPVKLRKLGRGGFGVVWLATVRDGTVRPCRARTPAPAPAAQRVWGRAWRPLCKPFNSRRSRWR